MSDELDITLSTAGSTSFVAVLNVGALLINASTGATLTDTDAHVPNAAIAMSDTGHQYRYLGSIPSGTAAGDLGVRIYQKAGGSLARSDMSVVKGQASFTWNGTAIVSQTGDSYARLGAPAGASISADIAGIDTGGSSSGTGDYPINEDGGTGTASALATVDGVNSTTDILRFTSDGSTGVQGLTIRAYLKSDYDSLVRSSIASQTTGSDGRWLGPMNLNSGTYYIIADNVSDNFQAKQITLVVP